MDQTVRMGQTQLGQTQLGGDPNRTQMADTNRTQMATPGGYVAPGGPPIAVSVRVSPSRLFAGGRSRAHALVRLETGGANGTILPGATRQPVNVVLVIDRSGSMEGAPLEYVKQACAHVVDRLTPDDVLSIVTFEETVDVVMPARRVSDPMLIKQHLARIVPGNTTNLFDGLYAGGAQAASVPLAGYVTRVLVLTDGEPTAGLKDFQSIVNLAADLKTRGITVSALGFGPEYNEELLAGIARRSGGNYYFIERPDQIPMVFQKEMESVLGVVAKNVRLALHLPRGATVRQCYGNPPTFGPRHAQITLPDLERGTSVSRLFEMDLDPRSSATYRVAKVALTYDDASTGRTETIYANAVADFADDPAAPGASVDPLVAQELMSVQAARDLEKTMMGMKTQQLSVADVTAALNRTQQMLTQQGRHSEAQEVAQAAAAASRGASENVEKTLIGTIYHLDLGKRG